MGGTARRPPRVIDPEARRYIESVADARRALYDRLEAVILGLYPESELGLSYGVPTYRARAGRVALGYWRRGVSFYPFGSAYLDEFRLRHPGIKTGRGTINFRLTDRIPLASLKRVIRRAIEHPLH